MTIGRSAIRAATRRRGRWGEAPGAAPTGVPRASLPTGRRPATRSSIPRVSATILIVEDEYAVARGIQYALQQEGYEVAVARSGEEGLEIATRQAPDLVVLDVRLPGIDGFEVLRRIRAAGAQDADPRPDGARRRGRQGHRARARRRRLPHQAVRPARADEPDQGAPPTRVWRPRRCRRRSRVAPRGPRHRPRTPTGPAR